MFVTKSFTIIIILCKTLSFKPKIFTLSYIYHQINIWRFLQQKIVFTYGCFDILRLGHIDYLPNGVDVEQKLIIGLNSDASTKRLKGNTRPLNHELSKSGLLAALYFEML